MNLNAMKAAAKEYRELIKLNDQIKQLSNISLEKKLEYGRRSIAAIAEGRTVKCVTDEDRKLILACVSERERLLKIRNGDTRVKIARRHGIRNASVTEGLEYI